MLVKIVGVLAAALIVSMAVTAFVSDRLTSSALAEESRTLARSQLGTLQQTFSERSLSAAATLTAGAEQVAANGLASADRQDEFARRIAGSAAAFGAALVEVAARGDDGLLGPVTPAAFTVRLPFPPDDHPFRQVIVADRGDIVDVAAAPIGTTGLWLVAGRRIDDAAAAALGTKLNEADDVVLLASGRVVGSTLPAAQALELAAAGTTRSLPSTPRTVRLAGRERLVAFALADASLPGASSPIVGVVIDSPAASVRASLARSRLAVSAVLAGLAVVLGWLLFRAVIRPVVHLARTASRVADGDVDQSFTVRGRDEIGRLAEALEHMRLELASRLAVIERQRQALREGSQRVVTAQDEERHRIARDLHDGVQQHLVVLRMALGLAEDSVVTAPETAAAKLRGLGADVDAAIERLRDFSQNLYPSILADRGLAAAIHSHIGRLPVSSSLSFDPNPLPRLTPDVESAAYFTLCEALTNAVKHSGASSVDVAVELAGGCLEVRVSDDGCGFDVESVDRAGGLLHMLDRTRSFDGDLHIRSNPGSGTSVTARFPATVDAGDPRTPRPVIPRA